MNVYSLIRTISRPPIVRFEGDGHQVATLTLSVQEQAYGPERKPYTLYVPLVAYGRAAEQCSLLNQADLVSVQGRLSWHKRVGKCKTEHSTLVVKVSELAILEHAAEAVSA